MIGREAQRLGLQWESTITGPFIHDAEIGSITFAYGFRDVTIPLVLPWHWNLKECALPGGVSYGQVRDMRIIFKFKDVADFRFVHERDEAEVIELDGQTHIDSSSYLEFPWLSRQTIHLWSDIDSDPAGIKAAQDTHGGTFRSARMELVGATFIELIFRECYCAPSDWTAFEAWSIYPLDSGVTVPPLRTAPLLTDARYIRDYRRHMCTTRVVERSSTSPEITEYFLCEDCIDGWLEDYAEGCVIPRTDHGSGPLTERYGDERSWERGRFSGKKCQCEIRRSVD